MLAAAALRCIGGQMQGRLMFENDEQMQRVREMGHNDPKRKFTLEEMAKGDVMFACTGVTSGTMLRGVKRFGHGAITHSMVMRSKSGTVRFVEAHHNFAHQDLGLHRLTRARTGAGADGSGPLPEAVLGVGRSLSGRRWVWRGGEDRIGLGIAQRMGLPEIVGRLLAARGVGHRGGVPTSSIPPCARCCPIRRC